MKTWVIMALALGLLGSVAVLAQHQPPAQGDQPMPALSPQQMQQHHQWVQQHQDLVRQQQMPACQSRCPVAHHGCPALGLLLVVCFVIHILLTVWVYQDIRHRNAGSGIWIVITLLTGLLGAAVYALVRLGERQG